MVVTVTLIRHGESKSNLIKSGYNGWKDSPLTELGERQAEELGKSFNSTSTHFTHLYTSDLLRAHTTALSILKHHRDPGSPPPPPTLTVTAKIREIGFGIAEGHPYTPGDYPPLLEGKKTLEELYAEGVFPDFQYRGRDAKFPQGESLNDLEKRIGEVFKEGIFPLLFTKKPDSASEEKVQGGSGDGGYHVGFVSHGLCLFEMVNALVKLDPEQEVLKKYRGHYNTGWTRLEISLKDEGEDDLREGVVQYDSDKPLPPLRVRLVVFDSHEHLASLPPPSNPGVGVVV